MPLDIFSDKEFQSLDYEKKQKIATNYFNKELADEGFKKLDPAKQEKILGNYLKDNVGEPERTWSEAGKDTVNAISAGVGDLTALVGKGAALVTGNPDNIAIREGEKFSKRFTDDYSKPFKQKQQAQQKEIDAVDGEWNKLYKTLETTVTDPALGMEVIARSLPNLALTGGVGRTASALSTIAKVGNSAKIGTGAAIGTGATLQGVDVGESTYQDLIKLDDNIWNQSPDYQELIKNGVNPQEAKHALSLEIGRLTGLASGALSAGLNSIVPSGNITERVLSGNLNLGKGGIGGALKGGLKGTLGEGLTEGLEEGGGKFAQNVGVQQINPNQSLTQGVGQATGTGLFAGGAMGGATGTVEGAIPNQQPQPQPQEQAQVEPQPQPTQPVQKTPDEILATPMKDLIAEAKQSKVFGETKAKSEAMAVDVGDINYEQMAQENQPEMSKPIEVSQNLDTNLAVNNEQTPIQSEVIPQEVSQTLDNVNPVVNENSTTEQPQVEVNPQIEKLNQMEQQAKAVGNNEAVFNIAKEKAKVEENINSEYQNRLDNIEQGRYKHTKDAKRPNVNYVVHQIFDTKENKVISEGTTFNNAFAKFEQEIAKPKVATPETVTINGKQKIIRTLNTDGIVNDGLGGIKAGDIFKTASGRVTTPFPKQKQEMYATKWTFENAIAEAEARGDKFNATQFKALNPKNFSPADMETVHQYLYGNNQPMAQKPFLKPLTTDTNKKVYNTKDIEKTDDRPAADLGRRIEAMQKNLQNATTEREKSFYSKKIKYLLNQLKEQDSNNKIKSYDIDAINEFEGLTKAAGMNTADVLNLEKFTNTQGIRNAIKRYEQGKATARDFEVLDAIDNFMKYEGDNFRTKVNQERYKPQQDILPTDLKEQGFKQLDTGEIVDANGNLLFSKYLDRKRAETEQKIQSGEIPEIGKSVSYPDSNTPYYLGDSGKVYFKADKWYETKNEDTIKNIKFIAENGQKKYLDTKLSKEEAFNKAMREAKLKEAKNNDTYKMQHTAPTKGYGTRGDNLIDAFGTDIYTANAERYFGHGQSKMDKESIKVIQKIKDNPNAEVTIYRAIPKDINAEINPNDWVTTSKEYAKTHGEGPLKGNYKILEKKVKASEIYTDGNSIHEWGYSPENNVLESKFKQQKPLMSFVGAEPSEQGAFSDIATKKIMREIDDSSAKINQDILNNIYENRNINKPTIAEGSYKSYDLSDVLEHSELYEKYPDLKETPLIIENNPLETYNGRWNGSYISVNIANKKGMPKDVLLHEIQHAIQQNEGWARGGSIKSLENEKVNRNIEAKELEYKVERFENQLGDEAEMIIKNNHIEILNKVNEWARKNDYNDDLFDSQKDKVQSYLMDTNKTFKDMYKKVSDLKYGDRESSESKYQRLWGEQQARATQQRMRYTPEQRLKEDWTKTLEKNEGKYQEPLIRYRDGSNDYVNSQFKTKNSTTVSEAINQTKKLLGKKFDEVTKNVEFIQSINELPNDIKNIIGIDGNNTIMSGGKPRGIFVPWENKIYFIADSMKSNEVQGVVLHELLHRAINGMVKDNQSRLETILGSNLKPLVDRMNKLASQGDKTVLEAIKRVKDAEVPKANQTEEMMTYLLENVTNDKNASPALARWVKDTIQAIKDFIRKVAVSLGIEPNWFISRMNPQDIASILRSVAIDGKDAIANDRVMFSKDKSRLMEWHKDSSTETKNEDGTPKVFYHGTNANFNKFEKTKDLGFHLGTKEQAENILKYTFGSLNKNDGFGNPVGQNIMPLYVKIVNPLKLEIDPFAGIPSNNGYAADVGERISSPIYRTNKELSRKLSNATTFNEIKNILKDNGYDGIVYRNEFEGDGNSMVAFDPTQIKSVNNKGTFDESSPNIMYSKEAVKEREQTRLDTIKKWVSDKAYDLKSTKGISALLYATTRQQKTDMFKDIAPELQTYDDLVEAKLIEANKIAKISGDIAEKTRKWAVKNKAEADKLFKFMGETTIQGIDPTKSFEEQKQKAERFYTYADKVAIEYDKKQREALNQEKYDYINAKWEALSPEAKDIYKTMKEHYERLANKMFVALKTKIVNSTIDEKSKAKLIDKLRLEFESSKVAGPYFPLMRFGEYVVSAKDKDNELAVERYETPSERDNRATEMEQEGFSDIKKSADVDKNINLQADTAFMSDVLKEIEQSDPLAFESISDDVYQLYLKYLPNLSARKAFIHRKGIQGYSDDMLRVFASKTFHLGRQIANVNYMDKMQEQISNLEKRVKETGDPKLKAIYEDLLKTHDHIVNPQFNELAQNLTSLGFFWYMTSLSAGLLNFTQIAMVVYPKLSGKYGATKAFFEINKSIKDLVVGKLTPNEKRFMEEMKDAGIVDLTMTHDLAGLGDHYNDIKYGPLTTVKRVLSIPQHYSEVGNRMVTLLTSYRLAKQNKESNPAKVAISTNYETNFNYTNENRSRWMRGPIQKVAFQFKNYSVQMLYFMMKNTFKALQGDKQALKTMGTLMVVATAIAGVKGLPIQVLYTMAGLAGVDDPEDELYAEIKELFGEYSDVVWRGVLNTITGADIGGRTGLGDMLLKSPTKEMNTRDTINHYVTQILGPSLGLITNMALGIEKIIKGDVGKGVEQSMPKPVKDIIQSVRFGNEGARDNDFKPIVENFKPTELATKAIGFQPERLAAQQESNMRQMRAKQRIDMERSEILKTLRKADFRQDKELWSETMNKIKEFNAKYPSLQIKNDTITKSILNSQKGIDRAEGGLDIAPKYKYETERYK